MVLSWCMGRVMLVWIMMVAVASGALAVASAVMIGLPLWAVLLGYPLVGTLGGLLAGMALLVCRSRNDAIGEPLRH